MKELVIKYPDKRDFKKWWEIFRFKVTGGFTCPGCGSKMHFDNLQFEGDINGKRFMFSDHVFHNGLCGHCMQDKINYSADKIFLENGDSTCDWCEEVKPTVSWFGNTKTGISASFGTNSWNGQHICQDCLNKGFDSGKDNTTSSIFNIDKKTGKSGPINRLGIVKK